MKVKLFAWWTDTHSITSRLHKQFIGSYHNQYNVQLTCEDDYDVAVVFGYTTQSIKTGKNNTIFFIQEPFWSNNWDREACKKSNSVYCPVKSLYGGYDEMIESPAYMFYGGHGDDYFDIDTILNYSNTNKEKDTSMVVTNRNCSPLDGSNTNNIYKERVLLAENILADKRSRVDVYGSLWEYSNIKSIFLKGNIYTKYLALNNYKFSVCIENTVIPNYITEKFYDSIFFNTVPIYAGAPNIQDILPFKDIAIILTDITDTHSCVEQILNLTDKDYYLRIANILKFKQYYFNSKKHNIWLKIVDICNNIR